MAQPNLRRHRFISLALLIITIGFAGGSLPVSAAQYAQYVVVINLDGLNARAIPALGPTGAPNLWRMRTEGAFTDNARTDYTRTLTTPSHTTILTSRPVISPDGHLWGSNDAAPLTLAESLHVPHTFAPVKTVYDYVSSVYDVVHDRGLRTALYHQKKRMYLIEASYDAVHGAPDIIGADNGRDKIDDVRELWADALLREWIPAMRANPFHYSYLLFALTDSAGHNNGFSITPGSPYMEAVRTSDRWVGQVLSMIESDPRFAGKTLVLMTSDHGGPIGGTEHGNANDPDNYTVPFYAWGAGVKPGSDLYALNPQYTNPGTSRPTNESPNKPIRNGDASNLALAALGLPPIPRSYFNADQKLSLGGGPGPTPTPCGEPTINPASDAAIFVWRNCSTDGSWHVRATAGGRYANYIGSITADRTYDYVLPVRLEGNDTLATNNPSLIGFNLRMGNAWDDGFDFSAPNGTNLCLNVTTPSAATILVGASRTVMHAPFNLATLLACGSTPPPTVNPNGAPTINASVDKEMFLWREADGSWRVRATAGGTSANYMGELTSNRPFNYVRPASIEPTDTLNTTSPSVVGFDLTMVQAWYDGFNFAAPSDATMCLGLTLPAGSRVLVGAARTPVIAPFNLTNFAPCPF